MTLGLIVMIGLRVSLLLATVFVVLHCLSAWPPKPKLGKRPSELNSDPGENYDPKADDAVLQRFAAQLEAYQRQISADATLVWLAERTGLLVLGAASYALIGFFTEPPGREFGLFLLDVIQLTVLSGIALKAYQVIYPASTANSSAPKKYATSRDKWLPLGGYGDLDEFLGKPPSRQAHGSTKNPVLAADGDVQEPAEQHRIA